ncbi:Amidases related to nicotinamidase [Cupriavidus taiwanensis]|uniref:Amidases related to nicotinamidase n=1 Tax=Cupriavidus taiwanensis TaxID=164546 RepID=A0A975XBT5_9BURK|nr:isochorismatase family protein [Cupriavidus taiwanensis]SOY64347.1 Amidases related to nicotinamidase [Cupriavidus taiwanensis]
MQLFNLQDTAIVLIDHQVGIFDWVQSIDRTQLKRNALMLAKLAARADLPVVLTTSQETNVQGPLMKGIRKALPEAYARRVRRVGIVNAWDVKAFAEAVRATGKRNLVMAGVTTDVCVIAPAISAVEEGFNVQVVTDASGSATKIGDEVAWQRMTSAGVRLTSTAGIVAELVYNWDTELGDYALNLIPGVLDASVKLRIALRLVGRLLSGQGLPRVDSERASKAGKFASL